MLKSSTGCPKANTINSGFISANSFYPETPHRKKYYIRATRINYKTSLQVQETTKWL